MTMEAAEALPHGELTAKLFLFLLASGGRWRSLDVAEGVNQDSAMVAQMLSHMARFGHVRKYPIQGMRRRFRYGVTGDCSMPRSVTVQQVASCVMTQPADEETAA